MNQGDPHQNPRIPLPWYSGGGQGWGPSQLAGYQIRRPRPDELAALLAFFPDNPLGDQHLITIGAFGQPGDVPLGAAIVRPSDQSSSIGHFILFVRPEFRRKKIGTRLMHQLCALALANNAQQLILPRFIHQDDPENHFYRSVGFLPDRLFATYCVELARVPALCQPVIERYLSRMDAERINIQSLTSLNLEKVARFFCAHHGGFVDQRLVELRAGQYDPSLSCAAVRDDSIAAAMLAKSRAGVSSVMLEVIVAAPAYRRSPLPLAILDYSAQLGLQRKLTHCVFEADKRYDHFAVGVARRCGATAQHRRYRYSINRDQIQGWLEKNNSSIIGNPAK